jgi:hypothetical protein
MLYANKVIYPENDPVVPFAYDQVLADEEGNEPPTPDAKFWGLEGELLRDLLDWITTARDLTGMGARCAVLVMYLGRADLIKPNSLRAIARLPDAPSASALSKALIELETKYNLRTSPIQKPRWSRQIFSKSAKCAHEERRPQQ